MPMTVIAYFDLVQPSDPNAPNVVVAQFGWTAVGNVSRLQPNYSGRIDGTVQVMLDESDTAASLNTELRDLILADVVNKGGPQPAARDLVLPQYTKG